MITGSLRDSSHKGPIKAQGQMFVQSVVSFQVKPPSAIHSQGGFFWNLGVLALCARASSTLLFPPASLITEPAFPWWGHLFFPHPFSWLRQRAFNLGSQSLQDNSGDWTYYQCQQILNVLKLHIGYSSCWSVFSGEPEKACPSRLLSELGWKQWLYLFNVYFKWWFILKNIGVALPHPEYWIKILWGYISIRIKLGLPSTAPMQTSFLLQSIA